MHFSLFSFPYSKILKSEDINNIQTNVEFLTNRITSASAVIAESNNANEAYQASNISSNIDPITSYSSPKRVDVVSYSTPSMPPAENTYVEDINANNYSISNDMPSYEQSAHIESPPKRNSIRNVVVDDEYEAPTYYNEPTYVEQQPAGNPCY